MDTAVKILGLLLILVGIGSAFWRLASGEKVKHPVTLVTMSFVSLFLGLSLVVSDRVAALMVRGVETIHTGTDQVISDVKRAVLGLKTGSGGTNVTIDLTSQAAKAKELSEFIANQAKEPQKKSGLSDGVVRSIDTPLVKPKE